MLNVNRNSIKKQLENYDTQWRLIAEYINEIFCDLSKWQERYNNEFSKIILVEFWDSYKDTEIDEAEAKNILIKDLESFYENIQIFLKENHIEEIAKDKWVTTNRFSTIKSMLKKTIVFWFCANILELENNNQNTLEEKDKAIKKGEKIAKLFKSLKASWQELIILKPEIKYFNITQEKMALNEIVLIIRSIEKHLQNLSLELDLFVRPTYKFEKIVKEYITKYNFTLNNLNLDDFTAATETLHKDLIRCQTEGDPEIPISTCIKIIFEIKKHCIMISNYPPLFTEAAQLHIKKVTSRLRKQYNKWDEAVNNLFRRNRLSTKEDSDLNLSVSLITLQQNNRFKDNPNASTFTSFMRDNKIVLSEMENNSYYNTNKGKPLYDSLKKIIEEFELQAYSLYLCIGLDDFETWLEETSREKIYADKKEELQEISSKPLKKRLKIESTSFPLTRVTNLEAEEKEVSRKLTP